MKENDISMRKSYNPMNPVEILCKQIADGIFAATVRSSCYIQKIVNITEAVIISTGVYEVDYRD